jgi:competence protein ComEA
MGAILKWIIGAVIGVVLVIITFTQIDPNINNGNGGGLITSSSLGENYIQVKIEGQVVNPGTYTISKDSTILDLVNLAGGYLSSADLDSINDYLYIEEKTLVYIPLLPGYSQSCVIDPTVEKVNLNTATIDELMEINGVSQVLAERIVAYRDTNGDFLSLEDLMNVNGIGIKTYEKIRDYLTLK